jgi:hypothetical protein
LVAGEEEGGGGECEAEGGGPAGGFFGVEVEYDPGDESVECTVEAEAAEDGELDQHEDHGPAAHEEEEHAAFGAVGDVDDGEPEERAVEADGEAEDFAVAAVEDRVTAAGAEAGEGEVFQRGQIGGNREAGDDQELGERVAGGHGGGRNGRRKLLKRVEGGG